MSVTRATNECWQESGYRRAVIGGSDEFHALVKELETLLESPSDEKQARQYAERRDEIERELIRLLRPDTYSGAEARQSVRVPCGLGGRLRSGLGRQQVQISNVSCGGAKIELESPLPAQTEVELEILAGPGSNGEIISRFGKIAWVRQNSAGVEFETGTEPLDQRMLRFVLELMRQR